MQYKLRRLPPCEFDSEIHQGKPINWAEVDQAFLAERLGDMMDAAEIAKWKDELESLGAIGDGDKGSTMKEIATEMKIPLRRMMTVIQKGLKGGRYVQGIAARMDNAGRRQRVPVYRLVE